MRNTDLSVSCDGRDAPAFLGRARLPAWLLPPAWPSDADGPALARLDLRDGRVAGLAPMPPTHAATDAAGGPAGWDVDGAPVLPAWVDAHVHLDKAYTQTRAGRAKPGLLGAIEAVIRDREHWTASDLQTRASRGLQAAFEAGTACVRTHVDWWDPAAAPQAWDTLAQLAQAWQGRVRLEQVALVKLGACADPAQARALAARVARTPGVALLGGFVHSSQWDEAALGHLLQAAQDAGLGVDLHVDEELEAQARGLATIARLLRERGFEQRAVCGHVCALAAMAEADALRVLDDVARAPITLVSLPITNLLLQDAAVGRTPRLRGITLVKEARARGIPVLFASDNVQDPFCPVGSFDPLEAFAAATLAAQLDAPFDTWSDAICRADWLRADHPTAASLIGQPADLIVFPGADARSWPSGAARRVVLRGGRRQSAPASAAFSFLH